jgi:HAE1 family hydrophobic/amphiphilic exporter-1
MLELRKERRAKKKAATRGGDVPSRPQASDEPEPAKV